MLGKALKFGKTAGILGVALFFASCRKEGCPGQSFSLDNDLFDMLAQMLNYIF